MSDSPDAPLLDAAGRAAMKQWLDNWKRVGPLLDQERWDRLAAMSDADAQRATRQVLELWQPDSPTDEGEGLILLQRVFASARRRP